MAPPYVRTRGRGSPGSDEARRRADRHAVGIVGDNRADTFPYPNGSVVGILNDEAACEDARRRLQDGGLEVEVLHGEAGLARIDVEGGAHGRSGGIMRRLQSIMSDDAD